jgi:lysophospholipase L1-like esterase
MNRKTTQEGVEAMTETWILLLTLLLSSAMPAWAGDDAKYGRFLFPAGHGYGVPSYGFGYGKHGATQQTPVNGFPTPGLQSNDRIAFCGDSITFLGGHDPEYVGFINLFQNQLSTLDPTVQIYDYGVPGYRVNDVIGQFNSIMQCNPTVVVLFIGINDIDVGEKPQVFYPAYQRLVSYFVEQPGIREVVLLSPMCHYERQDGKNPWDAAIDAFTHDVYVVAQSTPKCFYCPMRGYWGYWESKVNPRGIADGILTRPDGLHPNQQGHNLIATVLDATFGLPQPYLP